MDQSDPFRDLARLMEPSAGAAETSPLHGTAASTKHSAPSSIPLTPPVPPTGAVSDRDAERFPHILGYRILHLLGRGGMGVVYEAVQEKLGRRVALKMLPALVSSAHPEVVTRFQREAAAAAKLHHHNIIPIYDFGESRDGYYYAMELIRGQSLSGLVKRLAAIGAPMASATAMAAALLEPIAAGADAEGVTGSAFAEPPSSGGASSAAARGRAYYRQVARWMADAADALHFAHMHGLIHRDIKPGNLMVCTDGRIVVLDFGLVKTADERSVTMTGSLVGTYRYMSPEQVGAKRVIVDARTDLYSLGATLYELLTFQPAFAALDQAELLTHILFKDPTPPRKIVPSVPVDLQTICLKALEKTPNARYPTARAMAEDLRQYMGDMPIVARPLGPVGRAVKFIRRRRATALTVVSFVLLAGVITGAAIAQKRERGKRRDEEVRRVQAQAQRLEALINQGGAQLDGHDLEAAQRTYDEVLALDPGNFRGLMNLARVKKDLYDRSKNPALLDELDELCKRASQADPHRPEPYTLRGIILRNQGRYPEALAVHLQERDLKPDRYASWVNLGAVHTLMGDLTEAERCLLEAVRLAASADDPGPMPWRHLAAVQVHLRRPDAAATVQAAVDHESSTPDPMSRLLRARLNLAAYGSAPQGSAMQPSTAAREALRSAELADSLTEEDQRLASKEGAKNPSLAWIKRILAQAYLASERWDDAAKAAEAALAFGDVPPTYARLSRAIADARRGEWPAARRSYDQAMTDLPAELEQAGWKARMEGPVLWIDSAAELIQLRREAESLLARE